MSKKLFFLAPVCALLLTLASCSLFSDVSNEKGPASVNFTIDSRTAQTLLRQAGIDLSDSTRASIGDLHGLYINLSLRGQYPISRSAPITADGVTIAFANVPAGLSVYAYAEIYSDPSNVLYKGKSDNITIIPGFNNLTVKIMNAASFNTRYPDEPANTNNPAAPAPGSGGNSPGNGGNTPGSGEGGNTPGTGGGNNGGNGGDNGNGGNGGSGGGGENGGNGSSVNYPPDPTWFSFQSTAEVLPEGTLGENDKLAPHLKANPAARYVYFGNYPRSRMASDVTVDEATAETQTFGNYTYYKASDNNWYAKHKVKGNYSYYASATPGAQGTSVENQGTVAYFKLEPIKWRVLTTNYNNTGYALLITDEAIPGYFDYDADTTDHKRFSYSNHVNTNRTIEGNTIRCSNYQYSNARAWLNGLDGSSYGMQDWTDAGFINSAFTEAGRMKIKEVVVDNSAASCYQPYETVGTECDAFLSNNTTDKVFLLSIREVTNQLWGFDEATDQYGTRCFVPTDLAIASGISRYSASSFYYGCTCYLRTPANVIGEQTCSGAGYAGNGETAYNDYNNAMVPAICVDLNDLSGAAIGEVGLPNTSVDSNYALPGLFTVDSTGKQVKFSLGNLENTQETGSLAYHFAQRQSFYCRNTSGTKYRIDLMSYSNLATVNNQGVVESSLTNWRILSEAEWQYLLGSRNGAADKFGVAQVIGLNGLVILPDNWSLPAGLTFNSGYASDSQEFKDKNQYTAMQWDKMEKAGAVFLPACGLTYYSNSSYRRTADTLNVYGGYITGSGKYMQFSKSEITQNTCDTSETHNIRLVVDAN